MTERVKINTNTFKILKQSVPAGVDVNNANASQLAFNGFDIPYAAVLFSGTEDTSTFSSFTVDPWLPGFTAVYSYQTSTRRIKTINSKNDKGINQAFTRAPAVIWMVKRNDWSYATPSYSLVQRTDWPDRADSDWSGGAVWCSTALDSSGYCNLTIRVDRSDFATSMPTDFLVSYIVFQNFDGLGKLKDANGNDVG